MFIFQQGCSFWSSDQASSLETFPCIAFESQGQVLLLQSWTGFYLCAHLSFWAMKTLWTHLGTDVWVWAPAYCLSWYVTMRGAAKPSVVSQGLVCAAELSQSKVGQGGRLMAPAFPSLVNKRNRISSQSSSNSSGWYYAPNKVFPSKAEERWFVAIEFQLFAW